MPELGPPQTPLATRLVLLGSGELGREVAIEAMRLGCEVVAVDRYPGAPAMQVAHRSHACAMNDPEQLRAVLEQELGLPHAELIVVPELEAIATPRARAARGRGGAPRGADGPRRAPHDGP
ncbi:MAG: hypothetical protein PGN13_03505 [Patulibacter minatonensis]